MKLMKKPATGATLFRPDFERWIDRVFSSPLFQFPEAPALETEWVPSLDCSETDTEYVVRLEAPGIPKENLDVNLEGNVVTLSGKREVTKDEETEAYIWKERETGHFVRSLRLPKAVSGDKIQAIHENGVLTVRLPKAEPAVKSKILIK